jgi:hypothetical protein
MKPSYRSLTSASSVLAGRFLICSNRDIVIVGASRIMGTGNENKKVRELRF